MLAARASAVLALAAGGWALVSASFGQQQQASTIVPVVATAEASIQPLASSGPAQALWMPSRVAGHLADRLQALHEPLTVAEASPTVGGSADASQWEAAARTPPGTVAMYQSRPAAPPATASILPSNVLVAEAKPVASPPTQVSIIRAPPPAAAPRRNFWTAQQPTLGGGNPLRGDR